MIHYTKKDLWKKATTDDLRAELFNTLMIWDEFCKKHGLRYVLSGGTLLGAIRHHGFIPWDDDIDVNMPRTDCEKLMELSGGTIDGCILEPPNYSDEYHAYHWKLFNPKILVTKEIETKIYPIFIDIFPIEGLPDTEEENVKHYKDIILWKRISTGLFGKKWFYGKSLTRKIYHGLLRPVASLWGKEKLFDKVIGIMKEYSFDECEYVGVMATKVHTTEERVVKKDYMQFIDVTFEGKTFPGPASYDVYLTQLYGKNYMELPPVEKRVSNHGLIPYFSIYSDGYDEASYKPAALIGMCGLVKSANLGEMFIARSLEFLINMVAKEHGFEDEIDYVEVDLLGRKDTQKDISSKTKDRLINYAYYSKKGLPAEYVYTLIKRASKKVGNLALKNITYRFRHFMYNHCMNYRKRLFKYYDRKMHDCKAIVVDGAGLLEYSYNEYQESLLTISQYARKKQLQVFYNAIGRAGAYNEKDFRSTILKKALRDDVVKYISARDSLETVQNCAGPKYNVKLLADAAFWLKEAYKPELNKKREKIGIGIVRGNSLTGYGVSFGADDWVKLFSGIAMELEKRGYEFEFFTNGLQGDIVLGKKILKKMNLGDEYLVERPTDERVLYETINGYRGIITCRMHSAIAAFTLNVPSVILSWNDKVVKLFDHIGYVDRSITIENFDPIYIVDKFEQSLKEGIDPEKVQVMKNKAKESVEDYIDMLIEQLKR